MLEIRNSCNSSTNYGSQILFTNLQSNLSTTSFLGAINAFRTNNSNNGTDYSSYMNFSVNNGSGIQDVIHIDSSAHVGIGTTSPNNSLNLKLPVDNTYDGFRIDNSSGDHRLIFYTDTNDNGYIQLRNSSDTTNVFFTTSGSSYLNGGNFGIGTSSPQAQLHISSKTDAIFRLEADSDNVNEGDNPQIQLYQDAGKVRSYVGKNSNNDMVVGTTTGSILLSTIGTTSATIDQLSPRMAITNGGNVGIGTVNLILNWMLTDHLIVHH